MTTTPLTALLLSVSCLIVAGAAHAHDPSFGLPPLNIPAASDAQRELGRKLFFDRRLSINGTMSCGMCHVPEEGFTSNASQQALGLEGRSLKRNAPGLLNVAWQTTLFHDGRRESLETMVWDPILHPHEMGHATPAQLLTRMRRLDDYPRRFAAAFPGRGMTRTTVASALAAYQRTLIAADSPFDRWRYGGQADALGAAAREGFALFVGKARCASCHHVGEHDATFADGGSHVTGAGRVLRAHYDVPLAPGEATRVALDALTPFAFGADLEGGADLGRFDVTRQARDRHAFKTPSLRNVSRTAPYMHDGSLPALEAVIEFYDRGGGRAVEGRSALLQPLGLSEREKAALRAFLESLDSPHVADVVTRARR